MDICTSFRITRSLIKAEKEGEVIAMAATYEILPYENKGTKRCSCHAFLKQYLNDGIQAILSLITEE